MYHGTTATSDLREKQNLYLHGIETGVYKKGGLIPYSLLKHKVPSSMKKCVMFVWLDDSNKGLRFYGELY